MECKGKGHDKRDDDDYAEEIKAECRDGVSKEGSLMSINIYGNHACQPT